MIQYGVARQDIFNRSADIWDMHGAAVTHSVKSKLVVLGKRDRPSRLQRQHMCVNIVSCPDPTWRFRSAVRDARH